MESFPKCGQQRQTRCPVRGSDRGTQEPAPAAAGSRFLLPGENCIRFSRSHYRRNFRIWQRHVSDVFKKKLKGRDVYDYSEGEVLQSWNQLQIRGIFKLQVKFIKLFVNYVRGIVSRDENAVFLLNRFHF